ncbi:uncharacterized protein YneF (UPF0154 family) [Roseovarius sp. MBR-51]
MFKDRWLIALGLFVFCAALLYSLDILLTYQESQAIERVAASQYQAEAAENNSAACRAILDEAGFIDWLTCLADNISTEGSIKQAEYDLKAQQDMSAWAFGMLIVTVWLTVITLLGVFFVWKTLKATQAMAKDTARIGEAQVRAYLNVEAVEYYRDDDGTNKVEILITNSGQSPARAAVAEVHTDLVICGESRACGERQVKFHVGDIRAAGQEVVTVRISDPIDSIEAFNCTCEVTVFYATVFPDVQVTPITAKAHLYWSTIKSGSFKRTKMSLSNGE